MTQDLHSLRIDRSLKQGAAEGRSWRLWAIIGTAAVLVVAGLLFRFIAAGAAPEALQTMRVPAAAALQDPATAGDGIVLNATGYIIAAHKIELAAKVVGRVAWVGVERGDKVEKGQVLVRLEDDEFKARVLQAQGQLDSAKARLAEMENGSRPEEIAKAKADLDAAQADLDNAEVSLSRTRELARSKVVAQQELDDAESRYKSQQARVASMRQMYELARLGPRAEQIAAQRALVDQAKGSLVLAESDLANTVIRAPLSGTILQRNVEVGEYVTTSFVGEGGAKGYVASLADLQDLRVELDISQNDFAKVAMSQPCWVTTDAYPDRRYEGAVFLISPEANRQKATVEVEVKVLNPDALLRPDMNASVAFRSGAGATSQPASGPAKLAMTTAIPASAVRDGYVFVIVDGRAQRRAVEVAGTTSRGVEVTRGIAAGEQLIVNPPKTLQDGQPVRTQE